MLARLVRFVFQQARWSMIVPLLLVIAGYFWVFNFSSLPLSNPAVIAAGCGEGLLDIMPYYDASDAYRVLNCYGASGRGIYQRFLLADMSFVLFYGAGFTLLLARLMAMLAVDRLRMLALLPACIALADACENIALLWLLAAYPDALPGVAQSAGLFTATKHLLSAVSILMLMICGGMLAWRRIVRAPLMIRHFSARVGMCRRKYD